MNPPLGFDILVADIFNDPTVLAEGTKRIYAMLTRIHGSPPDMPTICNKFRWHTGFGDHEDVTLLTWDEPKQIPPCGPARVIALGIITQN